MTGNRFSGELCVYCNAVPSATDDHVFARKFFLTKHRDSLPQVPACANCNGKKARLESELMAILPFGGRYEGAAENLSTLVPRRLEKNARILRRLRSGTTHPWSLESGLIRRGMAVPLDWSQVEDLSIFLAKGLAWHHWRVRFGADEFVSAHAMVGPQGRILRQLHRLNAAQRVSNALGNGTFRYWGAQAGDNPLITVWEFEFLGGLRSERSGDAPCNIGVMTGPRRTQRLAESKARSLSVWRRGTRLHE